MTPIIHKVLESPVEGAEALGITAVRFYIFQLVPCGVFHTGLATGDGPPRYVGSYSVEHNAMQDTVVMARAFFKDQELQGVKIKKPRELAEEIPETLRRAAASGGARPSG